MGKRAKKAKFTQPTEDNDKDWPIGLAPGGKKLNEIDEDGDAKEPTEENE
jgi:hypothetical protein